MRERRQFVGRGVRRCVLLEWKTWRGKAVSYDFVKKIRIGKG